MHNWGTTEECLKIKWLDRIINEEVFEQIREKRHCGRIWKTSDDRAYARRYFR